MDTSTSKDNFQYLDINFVRDLQGTVIPKGSRFWILRSILVDIKNWKHICVKGEREELRGRDSSSFLVKLFKV